MFEERSGGSKSRKRAPSSPTTFYVDENGMETTRSSKKQNQQKHIMRMPKLTDRSSLEEEDGDSREEDLDSENEGGDMYSHFLQNMKRPTKSVGSATKSARSKQHPPIEMLTPPAQTPPSQRTHPAYSPVLPLLPSAPPPPSLSSAPPVTTTSSSSTTNLPQTVTVTVTTNAAAPTPSPPAPAAPPPPSSRYVPPPRFAPPPPPEIPLNDQARQFSYTEDDHSAAVAAPGPHAAVEELEDPALLQEGEMSLLGANLSYNKVMNSVIKHDSTCWGCLHNFGPQRLPGQYPKLDYLYEEFCRMREFMTPHMLAQTIQQEWEREIYREKIERQEPLGEFWSKEQVYEHITLHMYDVKYMLQNDIRECDMHSSVLRDMLYRVHPDGSRTFDEKAHKLRLHYMRQKASLSRYVL